MRSVHCGGEAKRISGSRFVSVCTGLCSSPGRCGAALAGRKCLCARRWRCGRAGCVCPACAAAASTDLKAPAWSCFPAGAGVGSRAGACVNFLIKAAYRERNALLRFAFSVVSGSKSSLAVKSSTVDPANGRISHSLGLWLLLSSVTVLTA